MNTHESYVSLETAKLLKQAGFNWNTFCCYRNNIEDVEMCHVDFNWNMDKKDYEKEGSDNIFHGFITSDERGLVVDDFVSAPTLAVAQRWLREMNSMSIGICPFSRGYYTDEWSSWIWTDFFIEKDDRYFHPRSEYFEVGVFKTYEEASDEAIHYCALIIVKARENKDGLFVRVYHEKTMELCKQFHGKVPTYGQTIQYCPPPEKGMCPNEYGTVIRVEISDDGFNVYIKDLFQSDYVKTDEDTMDSAQMKRCVEYALREWRINRRWFREDDGDITIEDIIKRCIIYGWQSKYEYDYDEYLLEKKKEQAKESK